MKILDYWDRTSFYLRPAAFYALFGISMIFFASYFLSFLFTVALAALLFLAISIILDMLLLYRKSGIKAQRLVQERLSNGDDNPVQVLVTSSYEYPVHATLLDELPFQLQHDIRRRHMKLEQAATHLHEYVLKPVERGEYEFGDINIYVHGPLRLVQRRYRIRAHQTVKVYPSYIQMRRYQLTGAPVHLQESGVRKMRQLGHSMEFEQIKEYVRGDDYRTLNWKASARRGDFMVNTYTDERSQQIYCMINKGRVMKMPFEGMTLLDYSINAALVLCSVALQKHDRAGLITFAQKLDVFLTADKKPTQINQILEALYRQKTGFLEPDMQELYSVVRNRITQRSLLVFFTNYETIESLHRELPTLKRLARYHLLVVVLFENTELRQLVEKKAGSTEDIYIRTIAEKYRFEKHLIVKELQQHGIIAVLTTPATLTVNVLNKYLELKNRRSI